MSNFQTVYLSNLLLGGGSTDPSTWHLALFSAAPTPTTPGTEITGNGYARPSLSGKMATAADGSRTNNALASFPKAEGTWNVVAVGIFDAVSGGNLLFAGAFVATFIANDIPGIPAGALVVGYVPPILARTGYTLFDRDLIEVPLITWRTLTGATEAQALSAFGVSGGALTYDTALAEAAGAATNWQGTFNIGGMRRYYKAAGFEIEFEYTRDFNGGVWYGRFGHFAAVLNPDNTSFIPNGATTSTIFNTFSSGSYLYTACLGANTLPTSGFNNFIARNQIARRGYGGNQNRGGENMIMTDNTFSALSSYDYIADPRTTMSTPIPEDKKIDSFFEIQRLWDGSQITTTRIAGRIHSLRFSGAPA